MPDEHWKKPQMWFAYGGYSPRSLSMVAAFVTGFQHGEHDQKDALSFEYFTRWVAAHYRVKDKASGGFSIILDRVNNDERLGFDEFFRIFPDFIRDMEQLGPNGICEHYDKVMRDLAGAER